MSAKTSTKASTLTIRKHSILLPSILLALTSLLFVAYALPSDYGKLAKLFDMETANPSSSEVLTRAGDMFVADDPTLRNAFWSDFGLHPLRFVGDVLFPLFKAYLEVLGQDFIDIIQNVVGTAGIIALYSLIPGLAGLIYRRQFTTWFLASFIVLLAVNASGLFPKLSIGGEPMPSSGKMLFFLLTQVVVLLTAYRLRRHGSGISGLPPRIHNWVLTLLLVGAGYVIYDTWDPFSSSADQARESASRDHKAALDDQRAGKASAGWRDCSEAQCPGLARLESGRTSPLYFGLYEVTSGEWAACTAAAPDLCTKKEPPTTTGSDRQPVEVSFDEAKSYARWLSSRTGASYRLPSKAEWEYAAAANAPAGSKWSFGSDQNELSKYGWWGDFGAERARHVGLLQPNGFGLHDIHGNLSEWIDPCLRGGGTAEEPCVEPQGKAIGGRFDQLPDELALGAVPFSGGHFGKAGIRLVRDAGDKAPALPPASPEQIGATALADQKVPALPQRSMWSLFTSRFSGLIFKWEVILLGLPLLYTLFRNAGAWINPKPKNIVICLDGTSNNPDQVDQGFAATTNVYKLFRMLKADKQEMFEPGDVLNASLCKRYDGKQISLYYAGVGNAFDSDPLLSFLGQATGLGAEDLVERAYLDLVRVYRPNDRVFIFGFSRGAAITRLLAKSIDARGAPRTVWTIKLFGKHRTVWSSKDKRPVPIVVIGCWDTVGSFGVAKTIGGVNLQQLNLFRDMSVPDNVRQAYHLVALDESRQEFEPTLMDPDPNRPERIIEVWFAGDHANIGGGWATDRLSDVTLDFLLRHVSSGYADTKEEAGKEDWGLHLVAWKADKLDHWKRQTLDAHVVDPDPLGQIQISFSHVFNYRPRKVPPHAIIHDTVFERMVSSLPLYAPQSLFDLNDELDRRRDLIDGQVAKLTESKLLSADDLKKIEGYKMKLRLNRFEDYYRDKLRPSFSSEYVAKEIALANGPNGSLDIDVRSRTGGVTTGVAPVAAPI
ncbi:MAG: phospholipase effector Tle1 domain-containing protein [Hyphomicrobium sp.]